MTTERKIEKLRIKNLEFRIASYLCDPPEHRAWQIIKWEPNHYYKKEADYIKVDDHFYCYPDYRNWKVHKDLFKHPETCFSIADFEYDEYEKYYNLEFVGERPLNLNEEEKKIFWELIEYGYKVLNYENEQS